MGTKRGWRVRGGNALKMKLLYNSPGDTYEERVAHMRAYYKRIGDLGRATQRSHRRQAAQVAAIDGKTRRVRRRRGPYVENGIIHQWWETPGARLQRQLAASGPPTASAVPRLDSGKLTPLHTHSTVIR